MATAVTPSTSAEARAQATAVQQGTRVRFALAPDSSPTAALVLERHGDTLKVLQRGGVIRQVAMADVTKLAISDGRSRLAGAALGAMLGAPLNAISVFLSDGAGVRCGDCGEPDPSRVWGYVLSGGIVGGLIGAAVGRERWVPVVRSSRAVVGPGTRQRAVSLGVAFSL